jgi:alpha-1,6-mannosyltransferase
MLSYLKLYRFQFLLAFASALLYVAFAYDLERSDFARLISLYVALFFICYRLLKISKGLFWSLPVAGVIFRILFMGAIPNLSQDFYRFIWDGRALLQCINPYLFTPEMYSKDPSIVSGFSMFQAEELIRGMGTLNASHFSNYPPLNQYFFGIAALFAGKSIVGSVVVFRVIMILADLGILYFGKKLLTKLGKDPHLIFWYFLNPFIIIELTGNLHFEGVMLFFVIWSLYLLHSGKWIWAAIALGLSVSVKLLPLMFLPLFFNYYRKRANPNLPKPSNTVEESVKINVPVSQAPYGIKKLLLFYALTMGTILLSFAPFLSSEFVANFLTTIALWFQNFEFNASVYYMIRWIGYQVVGWNIIATVGKVLPILVLVFVLGLTFFRKNKTTEQLITGLLFGVSFYFLLSTTVHPWYVVTPLTLCLFTRYRFPIVWSLLVMLSYSAYGASGFEENLWLVATEYTVVIGYAAWEVYHNGRKPLLSFK